MVKWGKNNLFSMSKKIKTSVKSASFKNLFNNLSRLLLISLLKTSMTYVFVGPYSPTHEIKKIKHQKGNGNVI